MSNEQLTEKLTREFKGGIERTTDSLGRLHNPNGPAMVNSRNGHKEWHERGLLHREGDKPAVLGDTYSAYYIQGKLHRDGDQPAVITQSGIQQEWYQSGKRHRPRHLGPAYWIKSVRAGFSDEKVFYENGVQVPPPDNSTPILKVADPVIVAAVKAPEPVQAPVVPPVILEPVEEPVKETAPPVAQAVATVIQSEPNTEAEPEKKKRPYKLKEKPTT
jgi:hypothetical protein